MRDTGEMEIKVSSCKTGSRANFKWQEIQPSARALYPENIVLVGTSYHQEKEEMGKRERGRPSTESRTFHFSFKKRERSI